jgi:tetratricopeptide (TPR) repeat protein
MQESQEHYFEEDSLYQSINRFEDMIRNNVTSYFDVYEFEIIVDYYLDQHNFSKANEALKMALSQHPETQELKYRLAQLYINSGKPAKGIRLLRDIEGLEVNYSEFHLLKGTALNLLGKKEEAYQAFNEAISLSTDDKDDVVFNIALSYVTNRRYKEALRFLKLAYEINPNNVDVIQELALIYERVDEFEKSIYYYKKYLDIDSFNDSIWFSLGVIYSGIDRFNEAVDAFEYATAISPTNIAAIFSKANTYINLDKYQDAIKSYQEILEVDSSNVQAYTYIGDCYEKLNLYKQAVYFFKRAIVLDEHYADAWYGLGISSYQQDLFDDCVKYFTKAVDIDPENPDYWFMLGEVYRKKMNLEKSAEAFNRAVELDPNDFEAWICRAELSYKDNNDIKGTITILKKAVEFNQDNATINYQLATYLFNNNQSNQAFRFFEKGLKINYFEYSNYIEDISNKDHASIISKLVVKYKK